MSFHSTKGNQKSIGVSTRNIVINRLTNRCFSQCPESTTREHAWRVYETYFIPSFTSGFTGPGGTVTICRTSMPAKHATKSSRIDSFRYSPVHNLFCSGFGGTERDRNRSPASKLPDLLGYYYTGPHKTRSITSVHICASGRRQFLIDSWCSWDNGVMFWYRLISTLAEKGLIAGWCRLNCSGKCPRKHTAWGHGVRKVHVE